MKITISRWNKIKTLLCLISMFSCQMLFAGGDNETTYYASLTVGVNPTGAGSVYVEDNNIKSVNVSGGNCTFDVGVTATSTGYEFSYWDCDGTTSNTPTSSFTVQAAETDGETNAENYTATAYFKRLPIEFDEGTWNSHEITWQSNKQDGNFTIIANNVNGIDDNISINASPLLRETSSIGSDNKITIVATYTLPQSKEYKPTITVSANPTRYTANTEQDLSSSQDYTIDIPVKLDPKFEITPSEVNIEVAPEKEASNNIQLTNYYFPINIIDNWSYALEGAEEFFSIEQDDLNKDKWVVKYHPGENVGTHRATLEITASFTDAYGVDWSHTSMCVITGTCDPDLIEALEIRKNEEEQTTAYYEFDMGGTTHNAFEVYSPGLTNLTLTASGSEANQGTLTNNNKSLTISSTAPETAGDHVTTFTLTGYTGSGDPISKNLEVTLRRWYEPIQFTVNPQSTSIELSWKHTPFATQYTLLRNGTKIEEWSDGTNTYTDNNVIANTAYTYTLQVQLKDGGKIYDTKEEIVNTHTLSSSSGAPGGLSILTLGNCPTLLSATGVNAEGAFATDGEALMDVLYIMDKIDETNCHVFTKSSTKQYFYSYDHTFDPTTEEVRIDKNNIGKRITNKKIYIAGTCNNLFWNSGDYLGWMQPVNCEIYLDNARLSAANNEELFTVYDNTIQISGNKEESEDDSNTLNDFSCVHKKASVFYLPENSGNTANTSTIHLRGKNYLGGNMAGKPKINMDVMGTYSFASVYIPVRYVMSNFSAPIAIKDKKLFTSDGTPNLPFDKDKVWEANIPTITCQIDATWADGIIQEDGYLDLSTRTSVLKDVVKDATTPNPMLNRCDVINGYSEMSENRTIYPTRIWGYSYLPHLRYEAPLVTGGEHGTFIINGGQINLWPANAYTLDGYIQRSPLAYVEILGMGTGVGNMIMRAGKSTNYMACGNTSWILNVEGSNKEVFNESSDGILSFFDNAKANAGLYGIGDGLPEGTLIVNGGTISANTDEDSYGYTTGQPNVDNATVVNTNGMKQPLFGPNVQINGGTFQWPLYGAKNNPHGTGKPFYGPAGVSVIGREFKCHEQYPEDGTNDHGHILPPCGYATPTAEQWNSGSAYNYTNYDNQGNWQVKTNTYTIDWTWSILEWDETTYNVTNRYSQPVSRSEISMDAPNKDYSHYAQNVTEVPSRNAGYIVNAVSEKDYQYGMINVWSDENSKCYFYLPCTDRSCMDLYKSYWVEANQELKQLDAGVKTYNLVVDKGGSVALTNDYQVYGRPYYRTPFEESFYHTMSMPFTVDQFSVLDPDAGGEEVPFTSWVDSKDDPNADNTNAYFYLYFLNDDNNKQKAYGVNNAFRSYYHTHTDGSTMEKGKTYIIKFLESGGYWEENPVIFRGAKNQLINGKNSFKFATRPTDNDPNNPEFVMDGNATFATQDISGKGEVYVVDFKKYEDDSFHAATIDEVKTLAPMQGYLIGSETTMNRYRIIGREGKVEQTALEQLIQTGWTAVGVHQAIMIMTPEDATAQIFTADGRLWKTITLTANTPLYVDAPTGFYVVRAGIGSGSAKKVLVE